MTKKEISEYNKLIAGFEIQELIKKLGTGNIHTGEAMGEKAIILTEGEDSFKYHENWSSLMRVIDKIRRRLNIRIVLDGDLTTVTTYPGINIKGFKKITVLHSGSINSAFLAVAKTIEWYNNNK